MQKIIKSLKLGRLPGQIALGLALVLIYTTLNFCSSHSFTPFLGSQGNIGEAVTAIIPPLSTRGSQIVDATGRVVLLRGVSWFGLETTLHTPHGLWVRDYKQMLAQIRSLVLLKVLPRFLLVSLVDMVWIALPRKGFGSSN